MDNQHTPEELAREEAYYESEEFHQDLVWDLAAGYPVKCVRCQQTILVSYCAEPIVCEACEPNDDLDMLDWADYPDD